MKEINLCEILKGHEGETFYSPLCGDVILISTNYPNDNYPIKIKCNNGGVTAILTGKGRYYEDNKGEIQLFPSKDQRDWEKWDKENNHKTPKTWSEIKDCNVEVFAAIKHLESNGPIEPICRSALAFLKIRQIIEAGYGGNITKEEWENVSICKYSILLNSKSGGFDVNIDHSLTELVAFHNKSQAEEFLLYPENIQLLEDYYIWE